MTKWILAAVLAFAATGASHQQTNPNSTVKDNYGTAPPSVNPITGAVGRRY
jgi:hypothetical protein